jgi:TonB family protein
MTFALLVAAVLAVGEDSLATARQLYASAAYEDALALLNRLPANRPAEELRATEQYRALCLLALGRTLEAETAIAAVVKRDPAYRPAPDASPRVRAAFTEVRRKMLPALIQEWYTYAKSQFDRKEYAASANLFGQVLEVMADPDIQSAASQPPLSDLRTLTTGFRELAENAAVPPPPPPLPASSPLPVTAPAVVAPAAPKVYSSSDPNVVPPRVIHQELPAFPGATLIGKRGLIEVVVDEEGKVESAIIRQTVTPKYDRLALAAAQKWHYRPATVDGLPVKYRKSVQVTVKPRTLPKSDP